MVPKNGNTKAIKRKLDNQMNASVTNFSEPSYSVLFPKKKPIRPSFIDLEHHKKKYLEANSCQKQSLEEFYALLLLKEADIVKQYKKLHIKQRIFNARLLKETKNKFQMRRTMKKSKKSKKPIKGKETVAFEPSLSPPLTPTPRDESDCESFDLNATLKSLFPHSTVQNDIA